MLRVPIRVEIGEEEQHRWEAYTNSLPEPTFLASATVVPLGGRIVLHMPSSLSMALVEMRLGGSGMLQSPDRAPTEFEQRMLGEVADAALGELPPSFSPMMSLGIGAITHVASGMFLQSSAKPTEMVLVIALKLELAEGIVREASICLPLTVLLPVLDALERQDKTEAEPEQDTALSDVRDRLLHTYVDLNVCFPELLLSPEELLSLQPGDVVSFHTAPGAPLTLEIGGTPMCRVVPTAKGKRLACMVVEADNEEIR
jgi:flagellar motor switch protein FliM